MTSRRTWFCLAALSMAGIVNAAGTNPVFVTTTSASRQFTAHAPNALLSSAICAFAEKLKHRWLERLDLPDAWHDPIVFVIRERTPATADSPAISRQISQIEPLIKYQITGTVPPPLEDTALAAATVEALCAEFANRDRPRSGGAPFVSAPIPAWLSEGLAQSIVGRPDQLAAIVRRSAAGDRPLRATEVMELTAPTSDPLYRAQAWLLTESLLRLPDGPRKMQQLLIELGKSKVFARAFAAVYGNDLPDGEALEKWWSMQQARRTEITIAEDLSATETTRRLDELLGEHFDRLWRLYEDPALKPVLEEKLTGLEALRFRAHASYRPVIAKYMEAIAQLLDSKLNRFRRAAAAAVRQRAAVDRQTEEMRQMLDRVERKYAATRTETFQDFFQTLDRLEKFEQQRHNAFSDYLDQFDK